jgi:hypothetical protein
MKTDPLASLQPIKQLDGTMIRVQRSGDHVLLWVKIGSRETSQQVDADAAERFWMGVKGALPVTRAVEAMKIELLNSQDRARLASIASPPAKVIPT